MRAGRPVEVPREDGNQFVVTTEVLEESLVTGEIVRVIYVNCCTKALASRERTNVQSAMERTEVLS